MQIRENLTPLIFTINCARAFIVTLILCFQNKKQLLRLSCETLKYRGYLEKILDSQNVTRHLSKCPDVLNDRALCLVVVYEIVFGIGIGRLSDRQLRDAFKSAKQDILFEVTFECFTLYMELFAWVLKDNSLINALYTPSQQRTLGSIRIFNPSKLQQNRSLNHLI